MSTQRNLVMGMKFGWKLALGQSHGAKIWPFWGGFQGWRSITLKVWNGGL